MDLKICGLGLALAMVITSPLRAQELKIIDVRRNIPLRDDEPSFKDFYINGGASAGLKPNLVVTAVRKTTIRDPSGLNALGELSIPVGQLKIIFVQDGLAVGREFKLLSRDELPMIEQIGIMGGDILELKGSFVDKRKPQAVAPPTAAVPSPTEVFPSSIPAAVPAPLPPAPAVAAPTTEGTKAPEFTSNQAPLPGLASDVPGTPSAAAPVPQPRMISVPIPPSNPVNTGNPEARASSLDNSETAL